MGKKAAVKKAVKGKVNKATKSKVVKKTTAKAVKTQPKKAVPKKPTPKKAPAKKIPKKVAVVKKAKVEKSPAPKKVKKIGPLGYTADEYAKFKDFQNTFAKKSNQQLKDLLRKNLQSMSGNKEELIYKCADGATLGRIPRCPNCFGGRPKFDHKKGTYFCSGYRDDTDFHNCHSSFSKADIKRDPWDN